jgi:hypothetical protein
VIEPALTAEEWAQTRIEPISLNGTLVVHDDGDGLEVVTYETPGDVATMAKFKIDTWDRDGIAGVIALANTALPDDDPRKQTSRLLMKRSCTWSRWPIERSHCGPN